MVFFDFASKNIMNKSSCFHIPICDFLWFCIKKKSWILNCQKNCLLFSLLFFKNKLNVKKKIKKSLYDFLWLFQKRKDRQFLCVLSIISIKSMYIKCIDFHYNNTSRHSHKPHVSSIVIRILILSSKSMNTKCNNFHDNNNHLLLPCLYRPF